jgi:hypothetical protein
MAAEQQQQWVSSMQQQHQPASSRAGHTLPATPVLCGFTAAKCHARTTTGDTQRTLCKQQQLHKSRDKQQMPCENQQLHKTRENQQFLQLTAAA